MEGEENDRLSNELRLPGASSNLNDRWLPVGEPPLVGGLILDAGKGERGKMPGPLGSEVLEERGRFGGFLRFPTVIVDDTAALGVISMST